MIALAVVAVLVIAGWFDGRRIRRRERATIDAIIRDAGQWPK